MTHLSGFGLENFRVFKDYTWFDFAPITILVGPNSSGKSSLIKALLLLKDNYEKRNFPIDINEHSLLDKSIDLQNPTYNITGYKSLISDESKNDIITFTIPVDFRLFPLLERNITYIFSLKYNNNTISPHIAMQFKTKSGVVILSINQSQSTFYFDGQALINAIDSSILDSRNNDFINDNEHYRNQSKLKNFWIEKKYLHKDNNILTPKTFSIDPTDPLNNYSTEAGDIIYLQSDLYYSTQELLYQYYEEQGIDNAKLYVMATFNLLNLGQRSALFQHLEASIYVPTLKGKAKTYYYPSEEPHTIISLLKSITNKDSDIFRARQEGLVEILGQKVKPVSPHLDFLEKWEGKLNIGGHLNWKYDSETGVVQFKVGDRPLSDIGFGMTQLITTLLATYISCVGDSKPKGLINFVGRLILLEEPEANLHPKLQSMLADLIADATQNYKNQFIIETHSEYMIRKFQYLVAKGEMKPEDIVIYYFNDPAEEKKPLKITIDEHGSLSDDFGPGFYDEAATWELELLKLKRSKNRQN